MNSQKMLLLLCHEVRLKLLGLLAVHPQTAVQLARTLTLTSATVMQNLVLLQKAGFLYTPDDETYQFIPKRLTQLMGQLFTKKQTRYSFGEQWTEKEKKQLATFVDANGRLRPAYPATCKKTALIVRWLASHLEKEYIYTEPEINEFVHRFHPDHAFWRRYLVDYGEMKRENGRYWCIKKRGV